MVLTHNKSGRFESRFVSVGIQESPSVWLKGMEGSALGVWVAHGEGRVNRRRVASFTQPISHRRVGMSDRLHHDHPVVLLQNECVQLG